MELPSDSDVWVVGLRGKGQPLLISRCLCRTAAGSCAHPECAAGVFVARVDEVALAAMGGASWPDDIHVARCRDQVAVGHFQIPIQLPSGEHQTFQVDLLRSVGERNVVVARGAVAQQHGSERIAGADAAPNPG